MAQEALSSLSTKTPTKFTDPLARARTSMQELHRAISDAAAKQGGPIKTDLEAIAQKTKTATEQVKSAISAQGQAAKTLLTEAGNMLNSTQKSVSDAEKASGRGLQTAVKKMEVDIRAAAQKVSEAVAAARSTAPTQQHK